MGAWHAAAAAQLSISINQLLQQQLMLLLLVPPPLQSAADMCCHSLPCCCQALMWWGHHSRSTAGGCEHGTAVPWWLQPRLQLQTCARGSRSASPPQHIPGSDWGMRSWGHLFCVECAMTDWSLTISSRWTAAVLHGAVCMPLQQLPGYNPPGIKGRQ